MCHHLFKLLLKYIFCILSPKETNTPAGAVIVLQRVEDISVPFFGFAGTFNYFTFNIRFKFFLFNTLKTRYKNKMIVCRRSV